MARITLPSGTVAELAEPADRPHGSLGLALMPDIGGLRPLFDDMCASLASDNGWVVCAPEPWPGRESMPMEERLASVGTLSDERVLADLAAAADATGCERVAVLGFCMGGMFSLKAAGTGRFVRAVSFYGMIRIPEQWRSPTLGEPLDALAHPGRCPVLAIIGGRDVWTPRPDVDALRALPDVEVVDYPDGEHGFAHDPSRPSHRAGDAADAWSRVAAFLAPD